MRQPCPNCDGTGGIEHGTAITDIYCPRCGGSGVERRVPLAEVVEALREYEDADGVIKPPPSCFVERRFGGGER